MSEYYAVQRSGSTDHLAHYGIKGMKWGVRKAVIMGDQKAVDWHFRKAAKKLKKLQNAGLNKYRNIAKSAAYGAAAIGTGTIAVAGTRGINNLTQLATLGRNQKSNIIAKAGNKIGEWGVRKTLGKSNNAMLRLGSGAAALGLAALSAQNAYKAKNSGQYLERAEAFKNAMDDAFAGTRYENKYVAIPRQKKKRR